MSNPYAPPRAVVHDIADPHTKLVAADRAARLGAAMLDGLVVMVLVVVPFMVGAMLGGVLAASDTTGFAVMVISGPALGLTGFAVWCWLTIGYVKRNGQSIGKKLVGIKVVRTGGTPVTLGRVFWRRNFLNSALGIIPIYGFLDVLFIFGESRQCVHDRIADTIVVKA